MHNKLQREEKEESASSTQEEERGKQQREMMAGRLGSDQAGRIFDIVIYNIKYSLAILTSILNTNYIYNVACSLHLYKQYKRIFINFTIITLFVVRN